MRYGPLKTFVRRHGGFRVSMHGPLTESLIDAIVEDWPLGCSLENLEEVVAARVGLRLRGLYSPLAARVVAVVVVVPLVRLVCDWYCNAASHRVLMDGWARN